MEEVTHYYIQDEKHYYNPQHIQDSLLALKHGKIVSVQYGICVNLLLSTPKTSHTGAFMNDAMHHLFGKYNPYPIEGTREEFLGNMDKWDKSTKYGRDRYIFLDKLIKYCNTLIR